MIHMAIQTNTIDNYELYYLIHIQILEDYEESTVGPTSLYTDKEVVSFTCIITTS